MAFIRKFPTASGATGVQVCWKKNGELVKTVHVGSANSEIALEKLLKKAQGIIDKDKQPLFDLGEFDRKKWGLSAYFLNILRFSLFIGRRRE